MIKQILGVGVILGAMGTPSWAGNSYFHLPPTAFRLVRGDPSNCFTTTTDNVTYGQGAVGSNPEWVMGTPVGMTNCLIAAPFTMPSTNTLPTINTLMHNADGTSTANKYCYKTRYEVGNDWQTAGGNVKQGWANLDGQVGTASLTTFTGKSSAYYNDQIQGTATPVTARLVSSAAESADCTGVACSTLPGVLFIERCECGGEGGTCGSATDAGGQHFFEGVSIYWTSP